MPVEPDLGRIREVGTHLDERRAEALIPQVEVVAGHPPAGLDERPPRRPGRRLALIGGPHPLELLGHADRGHPGPAGRRLPGQVRRHHLQLRLALTKPDPGNVIGLGERGHRPAEPLPELAEQHRRGEREPQMPGQERHHLRTGLQDRHVGVEIDPVQALDIQRDMPIKHIVHRDDPLHHATSVRSSRRSRDPEARLGPMPSHPVTCTDAPRPATCSAVRGWPQ
jgi:hypothetical protein